MGVRILACGCSVVCLLGIFDPFWGYKILSFIRPNILLYVVFICCHRSFEVDFFEVLDLFGVGLFCQPWDAHVPSETSAQPGVPDFFRDFFTSGVFPYHICVVVVPLPSLGPNMRIWQYEARPSQGHCHM